MRAEWPESALSWRCRAKPAMPAIAPKPTIAAGDRMGKNPLLGNESLVAGPADGVLRHLADTQHRQPVVGGPFEGVFDVVPTVVGGDPARQRILSLDSHLIGVSRLGHPEHQRLGLRGIDLAGMRVFAVVHLQRRE